MSKKKVVRKARRNTGVNKSKAILDYMAANPQATPKDVSAALSGEGIEVSAQYVSTIKSNHRMRTKAGGSQAGRAAAKPGRKPAAAKAPAAGSVSLESLVQLKKVAEEFGGIENTMEALDAIRRLR